MCDERVWITECWRWKVSRLCWWRVVGVVIIDTAIHMERVKILVIRAADEPGEQFAVNSGNTDDEIFLGKSSIKVLHSDYVQVHGESEGRGNIKRKLSIMWTYLGYGQERIWDGLR